MAGSRGFLVPAHYVDDPTDLIDMYTASIVWGLSIGVTIFNVGKAAQQTRAAWLRRKKLTAYVALIWVEVVSSSILGVIVWLHLRGILGPSFQFFFFISMFPTLTQSALLKA